MSDIHSRIQGTGVGLRRPHLDDFLARSPAVDFVEIAPENWMELGGSLGKKFKQISEQYAVVSHGLSLNIGGFAPLDVDFVKRLKSFFNIHNIRVYSEHLSYCADEGHLYDLMPIPFTESAVKHIAARVTQVQDILEMPIALENISYYALPEGDMDEATFINAVLAESDCELLLDVNNIYVNSVNHNYDAEVFLRAMPTARVAYGHVAGHYQEEVDLLIDTHGAKVSDPVWQILALAYEVHGVFPTVLERDFNLPPFDDLIREAHIVKQTQQQGARRAA